MQVVGVVVTYNRVDVLGRSLQILANQSRPLDHLIVCLLYTSDAADE